MEKPRLLIDSKEVFAVKGQTILEVCREIGINIPTLCHDDQLKPAGSCQICVVELEGHGLVSSCATLVADGMVVRTHSVEIVSARKKCLETFLFDHYGDCVAPCQTACPAGIDVPGYILLIARGAYKEAVELIKEKLPLPAVIGRICPHPCEEACRRNLVDQPISVCGLKRFAADYDLQYPEEFPVVKNADSGFRVAIVGAGPAGLSAAYYLTKAGHEVTIFEALPEPGGMLRYCIPDYRLPKEILSREIKAITDMGVVIKTGLALGADFTIEKLFMDGYNAVFLAIGAQSSQHMNVDGEDLDGVLPGVEFLHSVARGEPLSIGEKVVVIGGGNTAVDASLTALRLGAKEVAVVYRRSRSEMPAVELEVEEAEEEGVKFHFLSAPVRIIEENGRVKYIECIQMALGPVDSGGRPRPVPISGSEFIMRADTVIAAIGQSPDLSFLAEEKCDLKTEKGNIKVVSDALLTSIDGVFAGGDCVSGAATAVEAIAMGRQAAL